MVIHFNRCPACGGSLPKDRALCAVSKYATTFLCPNCGVDEELEGFFWKETARVLNLYRPKPVVPQPKRKFFRLCWPKVLIVSQEYIEELFAYEVRLSRMIPAYLNCRTPADMAEALENTGAIRLARGDYRRAARHRIAVDFTTNKTSTGE